MDVYRTSVLTTVAALSASFASAIELREWQHGQQREKRAHRTQEAAKRALKEALHQHDAGKNANTLYGNALKARTACHLAKDRPGAVCGNGIPKTCKAQRAYSGQNHELERLQA